MELKPGYKQTEVGMIPEDWMPSNIGDVATFSGGSQPPRSTFRFAPEKGYIRLIQIRDYKTDEFVTYIPESMVRKRCNAEDIMIGRYGPPIFQILRGINGAYNVALIKAIPNQEIHHDFFFYILKQEKLFHFIDSLSQRSSGQTGVEMPALKGYGLPLPPFPEQRSIATALSDMDELLGGIDRLITKKRDLKQSAMQQLLTGKTRLSGFGEGKGYKKTDVGLIPEDWDVITILKLSKKIIDYRGRTPKKLGMNWGNGDIPALSAGNVKMGYIDFSEECYLASEMLYKRWMTKGDVEKDDIAFTTEAPLGNVALIPDHKKYILSQRTVLFKIDVEKALNHFIFQMMMSETFQQVLADNSSGSTAKGIQRKRLEKIQISLPSLPEQNAIASILSDMDTEIATLEQRRNKTRDLKQAMMQELLTGRIRLL